MNAPRLSVIVPSVNGLGDLLGCLDALEAQRSDLALEVLVIDRCGEALRGTVRARYPDVRVIGAGAGVSIPDLRAMGFAEARADAVAVIEDHVIVPRGWARALVEAWGGRTVVVGGSIQNAATDRLVDWAAFLCEYGHCLPPLQAGPVQWLVGNNVVYPRELLERYRAVVTAGKWENHLHDTLRRAGIPLICRPDIAVGHRKHYSVGEYVSQRYLYARAFAGERVSGARPLRRAAYGTSAVALPAILLLRMVARLVSKKGYRAHLIRAFPLLIVFVAAWSAGELVGYWSGPADAMSRVC